MDTHFLIAAFEIAEELQRDACFSATGTAPTPSHVNTLLLLAHSRADLLHHSCQDLAAAALLTSIRIQAGPAALNAAAAAATLERLPAFAAGRAMACAADMWAVVTAGAGRPAYRPGPWPTRAEE